LKLYL